MQVLNASVDLDAFFAHLGRVARPVLLLDYDGTLAPFQVDRSQAFPYPEARERVEKIVQSGATRLVLISGRSTADLIPLLNIQPLPEIWGTHGRERLLADGSYQLGQIPEKESQALQQACQWVQNQGLSDRCESKPGSTAFHTRGMDPEASASLTGKVRRKWSEIAGAGDLELHDFDGGIELRVPGKEKGDAVSTILSEAEEEVSAAYLGDDLTDEDAFRAIEGRGLSVLVRGDFRPTAADLWLQPPGELFTFLDRWIEATRGES
ncbi:MAG: trehalose-phosphatase [Acidobacteriota bacterium]